MKSIKKLNRVALALAGAAAFFAGPTLAFDLTGQGFVVYGDAQSYSLPVMQLLNCGKTGPGCDYYVNSTPGAIKGLTVLGTGGSGKDVNSNFVGMEDAYETPNSNSLPFWTPTPDNYSNASATPQNPEGNASTIVHREDKAWDTNLLALKQYLTTGTIIEQMIFFFNNNQEKSGGTNNQSLAAWAQISILDAAGNVVVGANADETGVYTFTNNGGKYLTPAEGGGGVLSSPPDNGDVGDYTSTARSNPLVGDRDSTDYVLSGGQLCLVTSGVNLGDLLDCNSDEANDASVVKIDHNLGANEAAYAVLFPELNAQLMTMFASALDLSQYTMSVDIRLGCDPNDYDGDAPAGPDAGLLSTSTVCVGSDANGYGRNLNNGYEQIFISKGTDVINVPEPGTLLLAGLALLGLGAARRRRG